MFEYYRPSFEPPKAAFFSMGGKSLVGGFFVHPQCFEFPIVHFGNPQKYEYFFCPSIHTYVHTNPEVGLIVLNLMKRTYSHWTGWFDSVQLEHDRIRVVGEAHPVEGSIPDQAWVNCSNGLLNSMRSNVSGGSAMQSAKFSPLTLFEI